MTYKVQVGNFTATRSPYKISNLQDGAEYTIGVAVVDNNGRVGRYREITSKATNIRGNFFIAIYQKLSKIGFLAG